MTVETLKSDYLNELDLVKYLGVPIFLYPFLGRSKIILFCYYLLYYLLGFTSLQLFFTLCLTGFSELMEIINIAPNIGACLTAILKYTIIHRNKEFYDQVFRHFRDELWDFIPSHSMKNIQTFIQFKEVWRFVNRFIIYTSVFLIVVVDSLPWMIMMYENWFLGKDLEYLYPFDAWYPFDKIKWFLVAYVWESLMTGVVIIIYGFVNVVHLHIIAFLCMELTLLGNCLEDLISADDVKNINEKKCLKQTHENIKRKLKLIIKRHELLDEISIRLNTLLGDIMLLSYLSGSVFICLTAFSFIVVEDLYKSIRYFSFCLSLLIEMFYQCIIGQVLIDHSVALGGRIYTSNWIFADAETKKILLMMIMRTQRSFKLTAKGFLIMDLNTFSQICSSSYQFFNLLRTVYHP